MTATRTEPARSETAARRAAAARHEVLVELVRGGIRDPEREGGERAVERAQEEARRAQEDARRAQEEARRAQEEARRERERASRDGPSSSTPRIDLDDLDFVETHDCFTIAELIEYEAMGLVPRGQGARAALEGWTQKDGRLPVNPSGGLKAKGHPIGATGVSMHALCAMQLTGTAGDMQVKDARLGGLFNMGGAAVANYVSILEPLRA